MSGRTPRTSKKFSCTVPTPAMSSLMPAPTPDHGCTRNPVMLTAGAAARQLARSIALAE